MCLLAFSFPSFVNCLFIFSIKVELLFSSIHKNSLYILDVSALSILDIAKISPSTIWLWHVLTVSLVLCYFPCDQIQLFALEFIFEMLFKKSFPTLRS